VGVERRNRENHIRGNTAKGFFKECENYGKEMIK
jgi:hypothetical protein